MSHRISRWGVVTEESLDKGPFKLIKVMADGKTMDLEVMDLCGIEGSPLKDSRVLILTPDGDDGKAIGIPYGPPVAQRTDQQKPGEVMYKNHKRGQYIKHTDDGSIQVASEKDLNTTVPNNQNTTVHNNQTTTVQGNNVITTNGIMYINC